MAVIYLNGHFISEAQAAIPITDRGFLFGDGIFTTLKVEEGQPLLLDAHLAKLEEQAEKFNIILPKVERESVFELIARNGLQEGKLKIIVTGGDSKLLALPKREGRLIMMTGPLPIYPEKLKLQVIEAQLFPGKILAYLPRLFLAEQAKPCDDCLLINERGEILETAFGNVFWVVDGKFYTPDPGRLPIYFGVSIAKLVEERGAHFVSATLSDLPKNAQCFRINSLSCVSWEPQELQVAHRAGASSCFQSV